MKAVLITSSILIGLLAALRPILRGKLDPRVQYALWLAVALRLLIPVNLVTSAYSALALLERAEQPSVAETIENIGQTTVPIPAMSYEDAYDQALREYQQNRPATTNFTDLDEVTHRAQELQAQRPTLAELAQRLARPVWLGGATLMGLWFLLVNLRLRWKLRSALPVAVDCPLPVYAAVELPSPCLCGLIRPAIYVTPAALTDPERLRHVLAHELTHYRHRDHWWAWIRCVCLCLYWFNPLVWWAAALSRQDCELACDQGAIRRLGEDERISYGRTLVGMIAAGRNPILQTATTMSGGKRRMKERVALIARRPKTLIAAALALAIVLGLAAGFTFTGAPESEDTPFAPSLDTLQERLMDVPEELQADVLARTTDQSETPALVSYWMNRDWTDLDGSGLGWLLSVRELSYTELVYRDIGLRECFARNGNTYYALTYPSDVRYYTVEDAEPYHNAFDAIRAYAMEQVLATEGVEPYAPNNFSLQPMSTLQERLQDIPEELQGSVIDRSSNSGQASVLVDYWLNTPDDWELDWQMGLGWVFGVKKLNQVEFEEVLYTIPTGNIQVFARDNESYYAINRPTDARATPETAELYNTAREVLLEHTMQQVLSTEGITSFDADEQRSRVQFEGKTYTSVAYWPYKAVNGGTDVVWIYQLVQPAKDGPGGVWVPEREECFDPDIPYQSYLIKPDTGGLTVAEYAEKLQAEADAGNADWATDPVEVLRRYEVETGGRSNIPLDSFTYDYAYIESVRAGALPTPEQEAVQAALDAIVSAPGAIFVLDTSKANTTLSPYPYTYEIEYYDGYQYRRMYQLAANYEWEKLTTLPDGAADGEYLMLQSHDDLRCIWLWKDSNLVAIRTPDNRMEYYEAKLRPDPISDVSWLRPGPYQSLRYWFDEVQLDALRITSVPDRGQSHEDVVKQWLEGYEGAYAKCAPGGTYTCTYVQGINIRADVPDWMTHEELDSFGRSYGLSADDFGKTWFGFTYSLIFVPENENAKQQMQAGNTEDYTGSDAPEGAQICYRQAIMRLVDGNWVCESTGTGW